MTIEAKALRDAIESGVTSVRDRWEQLTGEIAGVPRPEYLTTTCVGFHLLEVFSKQHVRIRFEEQTGAIWRSGEVRAVLARHGTPAKLALQKKREEIKLYVKRGTSGWQERRKLAKRKYSNANRIGKVDITLYIDSDFASPFGIVENKGKLSFAGNGELYVASRCEVEKDLQRNADYVFRHSQTGGVEFAAFTFYFEDTASVTTVEASAYLKKVRAYLTQYLGTLNLPSSLLTNVLLGTWHSDVSAASLEAAQAEAEAQYGDVSCGQVNYGVISFYLQGAHITDAQQLWREDVGG